MSVPNAAIRQTRSTRVAIDIAQNARAMPGSAGLEARCISRFTSARVQGADTAIVSGPKVLKLVRPEAVSGFGDDGEPAMTSFVVEETGQPEFRFFGTEIAESTRSRRSDRRFVEG